MFKQLMILAVALMATGCATPTAPMAAPPQAQAPATRHLLGVAAGETIDQTGAGGPALVRPWGLAPASEELQTNRTEVLGTSVRTTVDKYGRIENRTMTDTVHLPDLYVANFAYAGDGELTYMGARRYAYRVPQNRLLVLNRQKGVFAVDGISYSSPYDAERRWVPGEIDVVCGPGDLVVFTIGEDSTISGYTCDPSMRNLAVPAAASAK